AQQSCPIASTLEIAGEKWSLLILRDIFRGLHKFSELHQNLGCPKNLLSARLKTLEAAGIIRREEYREAGSRSRASYHLTEAGEDLLPVLAALQSWGEKHLRQPQ
ncbi:MAG: helix-turn-helix domain-containing protein, partial [Rothia sp. (in: high G+C Gram-positive bacteria)]|nr:helix-turn-helix domain-containing protein [Rothia sp. (in: high G+C Gram-positive bacteria)]